MSFSLLEVFIVGTSANRFSAISRPIKSITVQAKRGNSNAITFGPSSSLALAFGYELCKPTADQPLPAKDIVSTGGNCMDLQDWYAIGTPGNGLNIIIEEM
jgi:hypothetical protein